MANILKLQDDIVYDNIDDSREEIHASTEAQMLMQGQLRQKKIFEKHGVGRSTHGGRSSYKSFESENESVVPVKAKKFQEMTIEQFLS